jgi:hypothetical protein
METKAYDSWRYRPVVPVGKAELGPAGNSTRSSTRG